MLCMNKITINIFILLILTGFASAEEQFAGNIKTLHGTISIIREGNILTANLNDRLLETDVIVTGSQSSAGIIFEDNTIISMGADSRLGLKKFKFLPAKKDFSFLCSMLKGTFIYISGKIAKISPDAIRIETPGGIAAVRGTKIAVQILDMVTGAKNLTVTGNGDSGAEGVFDKDPFPPEKFNLFFQLDSAELTEDSIDKIEELINVIKKRPSSGIRISGHTDRSGVDIYNKKLSGKRAETIREIIKSAGLQTDTIILTAHGEELPLVSTEDGISEQKNRRVEIVLSPQKKTTIILLEDMNGHVGEVSVSNNQGKIVLNKKDSGTMLTEDRSPLSPVVFKKENVKRFFQDALDARPYFQNHILYFNLNLEKLTADSRLRLKGIINEVTEREPVDISISGHTDRSGSNQFNAVLSHKRAENIMNLFVAAGINADYIHSTAHGEGNPLIKTEDGVPEPQNRRVEVVIK